MCCPLRVRLWLLVCVLDCRPFFREATRVDRKYQSSPVCASECIQVLHRVWSKRIFFCRARESADPDLLVCFSVADSMSDRRWFWMFTPQHGWSQHWHSLWRSLELIRREASVEEPAVLPQTSTSAPPGTSSPRKRKHNSEDDGDECMRP